MSEPKFKAGDIVKHKVYGVGQVRNVDSCGDYDVVCGAEQRLITCKEKYLVPFFLQDNEEDVVNSPKHYTQNGDNECIDVMRWLFGDEAVMAFCRCNIFKYRFRAGLKNGETDINKAVWYENYLHKMLQEHSNEKDLR